MRAKYCKKKIRGEGRGVVAKRGVNTEERGDAKAKGLEKIETAERIVHRMAPYFWRKEQLEKKKTSKRNGGGGGIGGIYDRKQ